MYTTARSKEATLHCNKSFLVTWGPIKVHLCQSHFGDIWDYLGVPWSSFRGYLGVTLDLFKVPINHAITNPSFQTVFLKQFLSRYLHLGCFRCQITEAQAPFHTEQQDKNLTIISSNTICH